MHKRIVSIITAVILLALTLGACGKKEAISMVMPIASDPMCIDPQVVETDAGKLIVANCYEGLVRLDENYNIVPGVAKTWEISADGLTYTFHLREDAVWQRLETAHKKILPEKFSVKVTANDFQFGLRRALDPITRCSDAEKFLCIKNASAVNSGEMESKALGVTAENDTTLVITLERANPDFLRLLTLPAAMPCNEAFFNRMHAKYGLDLSYTFCNGPFYLSRWAADNTLVIRKAEKYSGENATEVGAVYFYVNSDSESVISKFRQHSYDCIYLNENGKNELSDIKNVQYLESVNTVSGLCFNCGENALYSADIRKALLSVSKTENLEKPAGAVEKAQGIVPDCCRFSDKSYRSYAGPVKMTRYDEELSAQLWEKGLKEMDLETLEVKIICTEEYTSQMQSIIQDWQRVFGTKIIAKVETLSAEDFRKALKNGTFQIAAGSVSTDSSTAIDILKTFKTDAPENIFHYSSEDYDSLVDGIITTSEGIDILAGYKTAEQLLISDGVFFPLFTYSKSIAVSGEDSGLYALPVFESIIFSNGGKS